TYTNVICLCNYYNYQISFRFFFFQAEDGIRDPLVTGVQTCALPISLPYSKPFTAIARHSRFTATTTRLLTALAFATTFTSAILRSEERRVGKECRSGWWGYR